MGRPRKFKSVKQLEEAWEKYKAECEHRMVLTHDFSAKTGKFATQKLQRSITYTIEGFCVYIGISRSAFYDTYGSDERFSDTVTRMREECEVDARIKFETAQIPTQLAGLWMSRYGYAMNTSASVTGGVPVVIAGDEALED